MIGSVHALMEHVEAREPIISFGGAPSLPPEPSLDEQRAMQSELRTVGSTAVADAIDAFTQETRTFFVLASTVKAVRDQSGDFRNEITQMREAREKARKATQELERLVSEELESL